MGVGGDTARLRAALEAAAGWYRAGLLGGRPAAVVGLLRDRGLADLAVDTPVGLRWRVGYAPGGPGRTRLVGYLPRDMDRWAAAHPDGRNDQVPVRVVRVRAASVDLATSCSLE